MSTRIHVSGLSYFCTDDKLRQAFIPFGTVVQAQVVRDEWGHSLGLGIIHMDSSEDVERVFNEHQRFEVSGSREDLWEPAEAEGLQAERKVAYDLPDTQAERTGQAKLGHTMRARRRSTRWRCLGIVSPRLCCPLAGPSNTNIVTVGVSIPLHIQHIEELQPLAELLRD